MRKIFINLLSIIFILICYQLLIYLTKSSYIPSIDKISIKIYTIIAKENFLFHSYKTLERVLTALFFSSIISLLLGILIGLNKDINNFLEIPLKIALIIPGFVWAIVLLILVGIGNLSLILAISLTTLPMLTIIIVEGVKNLNHSLFEVGKVFKIPFYIQIFYIVLPQLLPQIFAITRTGFSISWKIALVAELFGIGNGIGYKINQAYNNFDVTKIFSLTVGFGIITLIIDRFIFQSIEKNIYLWKKTKNKY